MKLGQNRNSKLAELVGASTYAGFCDSLEEKRLQTSTDFEDFVLRKHREGHDSCLWWLNECIIAINAELVSSSMISHRAGGVLALTSIVLGMREQMYEEIFAMALKICLTLLDDPEARVRYFACEGVFNMVKLARGRCIAQFSVLFDGLCKLTTDPDNENRSITPIIDRLLKEIVSETDSDLATVESVIEMHLMYPNPFVKQVCIGWISLLRSIKPAIVSDRLPNILPSLLSQLSGDNTVGRRDLSIQAFALLSLLLEENIVPHTSAQLLRVLVKYANFQDSLSVKARIVVFNWIQRVVLAGEIPQALADDVVSVTLTTMASLEKSGTHPSVMEAVTSVNRTCFDTFPTSLLSFDSFVDTAYPPASTIALLAWQSKSTSVMSIDSLLNLLAFPPTIPLIVKLFSVECIAIAVLKYFRTIPKGHGEIVEKFAAAGLTTLVETIAWERRDASTLRNCLSSILTGPYVPTDAIALKWTPVCSVSAFTIYVYNRRFDRALKLFDSSANWDLEGVYWFTNVFELAAFSPHRLLLVSNDGKQLAQCLLKLAMLIVDQNTPEFKILMNRLQLVNVFKLL